MKDKNDAQGLFLVDFATLNHRTIPELLQNSNRQMFGLTQRRFVWSYENENTLATWVIKHIGITLITVCLDQLQFYTLGVYLD